jgi:hypothetical protein
MVGTRGCIARCMMALVMGFPLGVFAQAGPPMVTDDPGTPGDGHIEINFAALATRTSNGSTYELPLIDANVGLGDRIQLKLETPYEIGTRDGRRGGAYRRIRRSGSTIRTSPRRATDWPNAA